MVRDDSINCPDANKVINGLGVESCIVILTVVDLLAISTELLIRLEVLEVIQVSIEDAYSVPEIEFVLTDPNAHSTLSQITQTVTLSTNGSNSQNPDPGGTCLECIMGEPIEVAHCVSHYISVCIAGIFMLEVLFRLITGCPGCWKDSLQVFDGFIILLVFAMELLFTIFWKQVICYSNGIEATTYIVALRLLRVPRACNVRKKQYAERLENEMHYLRKAKSKAEEHARELSYKLRKQQREIADLNNKLSSVTVTYVAENISPHPPPPSQNSANGSQYVGNGTLPNGSFNTYAEDTSNTILKSAKDEIEQSIKIQQNSVQYKAVLGEITSLKDRTSQSIKSKRSSVSDKSISSDSKTNSPKKEANHTNSPSTVIKDQSDKDTSTHDPSNIVSTANVPNSTNEKEVNGQLEKVVKENESPSPKHNEASRVSTQSIETEDDEACLIKPEKKSQSSGFENKAYAKDDTEEVVIRRQNLEVMAEYEGTRTYRSAEGIPLTDL